jgi:hypothetical protein
MRAMRKQDIYGNMQCWIMTVKDHSTGLVYLCALSRKKALFVAAELEKYFGLIGYPEIFQPVCMLLPICAQFHYANGDSPYAKFPDFLPVGILEVPACIWGSISD